MASKILKGIATLFQRRAANPAAKDVVDTDPSEVQQVFQQNLLDTFGEAEVKEGLRIIGNKSKNPELEKLFYKPGETLEDELVNLLETRYMGSERLQAHPLNFNRRGPGAADRYLKINDSGMRLTDLPGGPADKKLYSEFYGNMSGTTRMDGSKVYSNPASILDEDKLLADAAETIDGTLVEDSLYDNSIADIPLINRIMKESGKTETEVRESIINLANDGYDIGDPKRMRTTDDDRIRAYVSNRETIPGDREDFVTDLMEDLDVPTEAKLNLMGANEIESKLIREMENMRDEARAMTEINMAEQSQVSGIMDAFKRLIDDGEDPVEATKFLRDALKRTTTKQKDGGRVHAAFGKFIGEGIMQAARLANKGIKPFGQKQTYKQKIDIRGVSNDQFNEILKKQLERIPDEVVDQPTGEALKFGLDEAEDILTGVKLGLLNPGQRKRIAESMTEKVKKQIYENPVPGLNNEYLEYMDDAIGRMEDLFEIERLGGDLTPKPVKGAPEFIQPDFTQLNRLREREKLLLDPELYKQGQKAVKDLQKQGVMDETGGIPISEVLKDNVIPFKPRDKKFKGGIAGLLRRLNPQLEKDMVKTGPFQTGHRADMLGDMQQIKNRARDEKSGLEVFDEMEQMIIDSPRYNEAAKGAFMKLIDYEKFRSMLLDDNIKLQNMMEIDPEGTEGFIQMLYRREGSQSSMFATGGIVGTLSNQMQQYNPYKQSVIDAQNAITNEDFFKAQDPQYKAQVDYARQQAIQRQSDFSQRINDRQAQIDRVMSMTQQPQMAQQPQMGQLQKQPMNNEEMNAFMQTPTGQGFLGLNEQIKDLGAGLGQAIQNNAEMIGKLDPIKLPSLSNQNVLNSMSINGLGNLFGTRSSYGN